MKTAFAFIVLLFTSHVFAAYDNNWYQADYWSGEYPNGFAVVDADVAVPGRTAMDLDLEKSVSCALPQKAVFHPWNQSRPAHFRTASKIVVLTLKENFRYRDPETNRTIRFHRGDQIEYLIYGSEGYFKYRYRGLERTGGQELLEKMEPYDETLFHQDEWVQVPCVGGGEAWILLKDVATTNEEGTGIYYPGIGDWWPGFVEYGVVRDLP